MNRVSTRDRSEGISCTATLPSFHAPATKAFGSSVTPTPAETQLTIASREPNSSGSAVTMPSPYPLGEAPAAWLSGPERIRSGWWDGQPVQRDYYVVQLADGPLAWVFRDLRNDWFIHGWFG